MLTVPSPHAIAALVVTVVTFWLFARGRVRVEIIGLLLIAVLALGFYFFPFVREGRYTGMEVAFGGFGHEALVAICSLMILGRGLLATGALRPAARLLSRIWQLNRPLGLLFTLVICGGLSMFVNDTPVLVLALPILLDLATRSGVAPSKTLMPANTAILIGGMSTTIGTSTNLLVISMAQDLGLPRFGVFQFTTVALTAALVVLPYVWLVMPRLLPKTDVAAAGSRRVFDASLYVVKTSAVVGEPFSKVAKRMGPGLALTGIVRNGVQLQLDGNAPLQEGDVILVAGPMAELVHASEELKAPLVHPAVLELVRTRNAPTVPDRVMVELAIGSQSGLIGQSVHSARIGDRYGVAVIGTYRPSHSIVRRARNPIRTNLEAGDVLLIEGELGRVRELELGGSALVLEGASLLPRTEKANLALLIMALVVGVAASRMVPIAIAALAGCTAMFATGCVQFGRIDRALSAQVIVLVAASIALGRALTETGAADWLGGTFAFALQPLPLAVVVAAIMIFAAVLTNFISNTAAAAVSTPIAVSLAAQLGITAEPLVAAVMFGANLCFVTPMAYQTNLMIMPAGGYQFKDYVRAGLPLTLLLVTVLSLLLVDRYGL